MSIKEVLGRLGMEKNMGTIWREINTSGRIDAEKLKTNYYVHICTLRYDAKSIYLKIE